MQTDRPRIRARAFGALARLLHAIGLVALSRPWVNRTRLEAPPGRRFAWPRIRPRTMRNAQILTYHRVNDDGDPYFGGVPTALFARQMGYLSSHFHVMPLPELVDALRSGSVPDDALAVTFDDGYRDNFLNAFPILRRHSIPATIFLVTSAIGTGRPIWHDDVFSAFRETKRATLEPFGPDSIQGPLATVAERLRLMHRVLAALRSLPDSERTSEVLRLRRALGVGDLSSAAGLMLTWEDATEMSRAGIRFGSHTATHPILSRVDRARARSELVESRETIEARLGRPVDAFAYPNGTRADFLDETKTLLRETGYAYAVTTIAGANETDTDPFELRRGTPWDQDVFAFGMRLRYNKWRS